MLMFVSMGETQAMLMDIAVAIRTSSRIAIEIAVRRLTPLALNKVQQAAHTAATPGRSSAKLVIAAAMRLKIGLETSGTKE